MNSTATKVEARSSLTRSDILRDTFAELPVSVRLLSIGIADLERSPRAAGFGGISTFQFLHALVSSVDQLVKRAFDVTCASVGLLLLSPLFLLVPIAIKIESHGPAFFRQTRHGLNNRKFRMFKFRSMTVIEDGDSFTQVTPNDERVTHIGRILRRTNIDELPQLINVLIGDMSIVGPRPHATAHNVAFEKLIPSFSRRHRVKPGITGWAQANGYRGETNTLEKMLQRIEHDLYYIDHWSFWFDVKIIIQTLLSKSAYTNAY